MFNDNSYSKNLDRLCIWSLLILFLLFFYILCQLKMITLLKNLKILYKVPYTLLISKFKKNKFSKNSQWLYVSIWRNHIAKKMYSNLRRILNICAVPTSSNFYSKIILFAVINFFFYKITFYVFWYFKNRICFIVLILYLNVCFIHYLTIHY